MKQWIVSAKKSDNIIDQLLINRKIDLKDKERFLNPNYECDLYDPLLFRDMNKAVERILITIKNKEKIGIFNDYDADGIPGGAILYKFFKAMNAESQIYVPTREEGYGLNHKGIKELVDNGCKLLITVDLGVVNNDEVDYAKSLGMDTIVTDHHEIQKNKMPKKAIAILHPNLPGQKYPDKFLSGGGMAWKLCQAIVEEIARECSQRTDLKIPSEDFGSQRSSSSLDHATRSARCSFQTSASLRKLLKWLLDLAAISTISDMVPLHNENRVIAKYGLIVLSMTKNVGLQKLYEVAKIKTDLINSYTVGFQIAPRINAPGRMNHAAPASYLLTTEDESKALEIARKLNEINLDRQEELDRVLQEAKAKIEKRKLSKKRIILIEGTGWPVGIVGLVAGRLMDEFSRPVIVLGKDGDKLKGSGRSIDEFHLLEALEQSQKYLTGFGGHAKAAGLQTETKHLSNLYDLLLEIADSKINHKDLVPKIRIDAELNIKDINMEFYNQLQKFEPHGMGNPRPVFLIKELVVSSLRPVGAEGKHLKLQVTEKQKTNILTKDVRPARIATHSVAGGRTTNNDRLFDCIGFDLGYLDKELKVGDTVDIVFTLDINEWNNTKKLQLKIVDIKKTDL